MTPQDSLKAIGDYLNNLEMAKKSHIAVGLPKEKVGGKIYGGGLSVINIGSFHEYGTEDVPRRSFLRVPFAVKRDDLATALNQAFRQVAEGKANYKDAFEMVGIRAQQISQDAFTNKGYGIWDDISDATKDRKGSSQPLIDTGILRSSITYQVRTGA